MSITTLSDRDSTNTSEPPHNVLYDTQFAFLFVGQVCFVLTNTILAHYARWVEFLGGSVADVGWVMGLAVGFALIARPWIGQLINRTGTHKVWNLGLVILALSIAGNCFILSMSWIVYLLRSGLMLSGGLIYISALTHVTQRAPRHRQTEALAVFGSAGFFAIMTGPYLGDLILGSSPRTREDFLLLFTVSTILCLLTLLLWAFVKPVSSGSPRSSFGLKEFFNTSRTHWPGGVLFVCAAFGISMTVPFVFLPSYVDHSFLSSKFSSPVGIFFLVYGGWGLTVRLSSKAVADRVGRRKVLCLGLLFTTIGLWSFLFVTPEQWWLLFIPAVLIGTGHALCYPTMNALILGPFPNSRRGTGSALSVIFSDIGGFIGAPLLGNLVGYTGFSGIFIVTGAISLASFIFYVALSIPIWQQQWNSGRT